MDGWDFTRFKFRKWCISFYVFAVRKYGEKGFQCGEDLHVILHSVVALNDFLDHTAMLALPNQKSINFSSSNTTTHHPVSCESSCFQIFLFIYFFNKIKHVSLPCPFRVLAVSTCPEKY